MAVFYYETGSTDPCYNLAFEEYLLENCLQGDILMLWQNYNTVVVGRNQNTAEEINAAFVKEHDIRVVRRITGGGAVYHDLGNLNYSFITDCEDISELNIDRFSRTICSALAGLGLHAEPSGRNDILIDGKKISGVAQRVYKNRILHHGTLLFDSDTAMLSGALNADPSKFLSKSSKSVRSRVGNIKSFLPADMGIEDFWEQLLQQFSKDGCIRTQLNEQEREKVSELAKSKYRSWDWTYGKNPEYNLKNRVRYPGGLLEVKLLVKNGVITQASFSGDFLATADLTEAVDALLGVRLQEVELRKALIRVYFPGMFGCISLDEIVAAILC